MAMVFVFVVPLLCCLWPWVGLFLGKEFWLCCLGRLSLCGSVCFVSWPSWFGVVVSIEGWEFPFLLLLYSTLCHIVSLGL